MKIEQGRSAVWQHAAEAGLQDDIARIAAVFDIADIAIHTPGKLTYLHQRPVKYTRIRPFESDVRIEPSTGDLVAKDTM